MNFDLNRYIEWVTGFLGRIDLVGILTSLKDITPLDLFTNWWLLGGLSLVVVTLLLLRALKTLSLLFGIFALWASKVYFMPSGGEELELTKLISFAVICLFVGVLWIYMFFVRGD